MIVYSEAGLSIVNQSQKSIELSADQQKAEHDDLNNIQINFRWRQWGRRHQRKFSTHVSEWGEMPLIIIVDT